jgi:hypothetical protein
MWLNVAAELFLLNTSYCCYQNGFTRRYVGAHIGFPGCSQTFWIIVFSWSLNLCRHLINSLGWFLFAIVFSRFLSPSVVCNFKEAYLWHTLSKIKRKLSCQENHIFITPVTCILCHNVTLFYTSSITNWPLSLPWLHSEMAHCLVR